MIKKLIKGAVSLLAVILIFSCATTSGAPDWVTSPPADDSDFVYFTGIGSDADGDTGLAFEQASSIILSDITRYLDVNISSDSSLELRDAYGEYESEIKAVIKENSSARITGMKIREVWIDESGDGVDVHVLVEYEKAALKAEKDRLEALFKEKQEAISGPEAEGDALVSEERYYRAAVKFLEAAMAASTSELENSAIKFERNINKAKQAINRIEIEPVSAPEGTYINRSFPESFKVKLTGGSKALEGLPVTVSYKEMRTNGRKTVKTFTGLTGADGVFEFNSPAPGFVGKEKITFFLDMRALVEPLEDVPFELLKYVDGLEQEVNNKRYVFEYNVFSMAVEIPTCIMVMDVDRSGNPLDKTDTAAGILSELSAAGFDVYVVPVDYRMTAVNDSELINMMNAQYGNSYDRMIFGTAEISSFEEGNGAFTVKVTGSLKAVELATGKILFSSSEQKRAIGGNNAGTISAAFNSLGKIYGEKLVNELP